MRIRSKLFLLLLALALIPLLVLGTVSYYLARDAVETEVKSRLTRVSDDLRRELNAVFAEVDAVAAAIGEDYSFRVYARHVGRQDVSMLRDVLEQTFQFHLQRDDRYLGIIATFQGGDRFVVLKPGMTELSLAEDRPITFVGDDLFCFTRTVSHDTAKAVLHIYVRPALLGDAVLRVGLDETSPMTGFFALDGRVFSTRPDAVPAALPPPHSGTAEWIHEGEKVAAAGGVGDLPLVAGVALSEDAYLEPVRRLRTAAFLVGVLTFLGVSLAAMIFAAGIVRPVSALVRLTHAFSGGDLGARLPPGRADELGDLARDFNAMAGSLEESRKRLAERGLLLEEEKARVQLAINMCRNVLAVHGFEAQAHAVCEEIRLHVKAHRVAVHLVNHEEKRVEGVAAAGVNAAWVRGQDYPLEDQSGPGMTAAIVRCAVHGKTETGRGLGAVSLADGMGEASHGARSAAAGVAESGPVIAEAARAVPVAPDAAFACIPLRGHGHTIGVVAIVAPPSALDAGMLATVEAFAHLVALAILEARTAAEAREAYIDVLSALAGVIEKRDAYTGMHTENVLAYSTALARAVGLSEEDIEGIRIGAILHDIGKVAMADSSLQKTGALTREEFEEVKRHPMVGYEILSGARFLKAAREIVRHHHERWDGTGYPDSLKGTEIPVAAQIVAIADAYDAMTTDRPYRKGLSGAEAMARLRAASGSQFNPYLVSLFIETLGLEESESGYRMADRRVGAALWFDLGGHLTLEAGRAVLARAVEWMKQDGKKVVISLLEVEKLTDGGIWLLLRLSWRCRAAGGVLVLVARGAVRDQILMLAADFPFRIVEDERAATAMV